MEVGLRSDRAEMESTRDTLEEAGQWDSLDWDFRDVVEAAILLFETCNSEIELVLKDLPDTVRSDHVTSLKALAQRAQELNTRFGEVWNRDGFVKTYGDPWFSAVEELYVTGRESAADLLDLTSLAERLADFVGRGHLPWFQRPFGVVALAFVAMVIATLFLSCLGK